MSVVEVVNVVFLWLFSLLELRLHVILSELIVIVIIVILVIIVIIVLMVIITIVIIVNARY